MSDWEVPERIWLQPHMHPEVTWCADKIEDDDVEYVRAAKLAAAEAENARVQEVLRVHGDEQIGCRGVCNCLDLVRAAAGEE